MLPPDAYIQGEACRQEDALAGQAAMHGAVRAAMMGAEAVGSMQGALGAYPIGSLCIASLSATS